MAPSVERREQHQDVGGAIAFVLVVVPRQQSGLHRLRRACLGDKLLGCFIEADQRPRRIMRPRIDVEHILHRSDEGSVGMSAGSPSSRSVRFEIVFLSARPTLLKCAASTILRSTTCSANRRMVQRARPAAVSRPASQFGLRLAIENRRNGRCFALLAHEHRIEPLGHECSRTRDTMVRFVSNASMISVSSQPGPPSARLPSAGCAP
jgi:hypothetical protein